MTNTAQKLEQICLRHNEIAAFLDGELELSDKVLFEQHLAECSACNERLNEQKRLLHALEFAFDDQRSFELPKDFAKTVAIRAESNVSGLRSASERRHAFFISSGLLFFGALIGIIGERSGLLPEMFGNFLTQIVVVADVLGKFCYEFGVGLSVVMRVCGRQFGLESSVGVVSIVILMIMSVGALSRLLFKYHNSQSPQ